MPDGSMGESGAQAGTALLAAGRPGEALQVLRQVLTRSDHTPVTALNCALAELAAGDSALACREIRDLAEHYPDWDEPRVRLAEAERAAGRLDAAEAAYRHVLEINPRRPEALIALAGLLLGRDAAHEARDLLLRACGVAADRAEAWNALCIALMRTDEASLALSASIEAQRLRPDSLAYALQGVEAAVAAHESEAELARLEAACASDPLLPALHVARGALYERTGNRPAAIDAIEVACILAPDHPQAAALLGGLLARSNRLREAATALQRAAELDPGNRRLDNDRATVLMRMHRHAEAHDILTALATRDSEDLTIRCNLVNATVCLGQQDAAVALAAETIALAPDSATARRALCNALPYQDGVTGRVLLSKLRDYGDRLPRAVLPPLRNHPDPDRPLVVGLLSGTLKSHPVGWLTVAGFETLDPESFKLICLAQQTAPNDPIERRFRAVARGWLDVDILNDVALAHAAREQGVDVLIDLGGYGDAARMSACAHRLAPVQIKWVGMQNHSSGLAEMDWFVSDRWETPQGFEALYSERLLRLQDGYVCYSPPPYAPDLAPLPALQSGRITFGCFNNLAKITPRVITVWCRILRAVPDARLVLKTHQFGDSETIDRMRGAFVAGGIEAARLEFRGSSGHRAFLREYNDIDMALDPFPYSGGLTTCEALWMGVPTVTLAGEIFAARHSTSHLSNAGLEDWVAYTEDDYVRIAATRAADRTGLAALRAGLRSQVRDSPLCDAPRFGQSLGEALRHAWRAWCCST